MLKSSRLVDSSGGPLTSIVLLHGYMAPMDTKKTDAEPVDGRGDELDRGTSNARSDASTNGTNGFETTSTSDRHTIARRSRRLYGVSIASAIASCGARHAPSESDSARSPGDISAWRIAYSLS